MNGVKKMRKEGREGMGEREISKPYEAKFVKQEGINKTNLNYDHRRKN